MIFRTLGRMNEAANCPSPQVFLLLVIVFAVAGSAAPGPFHEGPPTSLVQMIIAGEPG